ncbi:hypothetical protein D9M72_510500 [compost metagenome]
MREVEGEAPDRDYVGLHRDRPPRQRPQSRQQLLKGKGFADVIVGPTIEPCNPVGEVVECGQHQHRHVVAARTYRGNEREPVTIRKLAVEHDDIVDRIAQDQGRFGEVARMIRDHPVIAQCRPQRTREFFLILDQQDPHDCASPRANVVTRAQRSAASLREPVIRPMGQMLVRSVSSKRAFLP